MANKSPTDILRKEHEKVLKILDKLENCIETKNIKSSSECVVNLEKEFESHSLGKEEKVLFLELEKFIPRDGGPTGVMIAEHEDLSESIKEFKEVAKAGDFSKVEMLGSHIVSLLRQHIDKENNILFMIADMHLDDKQKKTIMEKFKKFDKK